MAHGNSELTVSPIEARFGVISKQAASCESHGAYIAIISKHREGLSGCPVCAEDLRKQRDQDEQAEMHRRYAKERTERRLGNSLIPPRFAGKTFADYACKSPKQEANLKACREYARNFSDNLEAGRCLLLLGNVGTGKTHLASAIATEIVSARGGVAVYRTVHSLLQYVKGSFARDASYTEAQAYESLIEPQLLVIDEIGATKQTEFEQAALFNVINGRYEQQVPTLIVSNLRPTELPAALGDRCVDRLRENGGIALVFDWESARSSL